MKILHYSHDSLGLGHIRRTLAIVRRLAHDMPGIAQMVLTGSAQFGAFNWPANVDCVKLPTIRKKENGEYHSPHSHGSLEAISSLREGIIMNTISHFKQDIMLVDKAPAGLNGEMVRPLHYLKEKFPHTRVVLGMRDIEDAPEITCRDWERDGIYPLLKNTYDAILLYGAREVFDPVLEYNLSPTIERKIYPCGYIFGADESQPKSNHLREKLGIDEERLVLVTAGGGSDGFQITKTYLEMLSNLSTPASFHSLIVAGPQMDVSEYQMLEKWAAEIDSPITLKTFTPHLSSYLSIADLVVTMGGYNTVMEIMGYGRRSIIVPRVSPHREQLIRAERLVARNLVRMIYPDELTPMRLLAEVEAGLEERSQTFPPSRALNMNGAEEASRALIGLLNNRFKAMDSAHLVSHQAALANKDGFATDQLEQRKSSDSSFGPTTPEWMFS
ncbi:MAG: glycosyltransferase [Candidatus Nitrotoga sp.]